MLKERLEEEMKAAMKNRKAEPARLDVIRSAVSAIRHAEIEQGRDLSEDEVIEVLSRELKQRRETLEGFRQAGRPEAVEKAQAAVDYLQEYLPEPLKPEELESVVRETIDEAGAHDLSDMGRVMGAVMPKVKGRAEGAEVSRIVRSMLNGE